jgi:hypothetical protein
VKGLLDFYSAHGDAPANALPVDQWHPAFCGDIDMRIASNGVWLYNGTPIERPAMVRLFSRILRREGGSYYLVTPAEKVRITVDDVPFVAVSMMVEAEALTFHTHVGDTVTADADHCLRFEIDADDAVRPSITEARLTPAVARELLGLATSHDGWFGVSSKGVFFAIAPIP